MNLSYWRCLFTLVVMTTEANPVPAALDTELDRESMDWLICEIELVLEAQGLVMWLYPLFESSNGWWWKTVPWIMAIFGLRARTDGGSPKLGCWNMIANWATLPGEPTVFRIFNLYLKLLFPNNTFHTAVLLNIPKIISWPKSQNVGVLYEWIKRPYCRILTSSSPRGCIIVPSLTSDTELIICRILSAV